MFIATTSLAASLDKGKKILEIKIFICDGGVTAINSLSKPKIQLEYISTYAGIAQLVERNLAKTVFHASKPFK